MSKHFLLFFVYLLGVTTAPAFSQSAAKQVIQAVEINDSSPWFGERFYRIYHSGPFVVYQNQYLFHSSEERLDHDTVVSTQEQSEWRSYYFVFHKDSSYGRRFEPSNKTYNQRFR